MEIKPLPINSVNNTNTTGIDSTQTTGELANLPSYKSLSPLDSKTDSKYITPLRWALDHAKDQNITNIALTGPYGSGKSTILRSLQNVEGIKEKYYFLTISLAKFKEEEEARKAIIKEESDTKKSDGKTTSDLGHKSGKEENLIIDHDETLRRIELSILQQIFYHEHHENIPDSRFKRIKPLLASEQKELVSIVFIFILAVLFLWKPKELVNFIGLNYYEVPLVKYLKFLATLFCLWTSYHIVKHLIKLIRGIGVSKLMIQNAEITLNNGFQKSILNEHLDELLYFFRVTPYNVVIVEDLDRFRQTEIFTKLRELNQMINNSNEVKRHVVFIYAVRDEMFKDKDRTKFFDFIVPVVPVLNFSNSFDNLKDILITVKNDEANNKTDQDTQLPDATSPSFPSLETVDSIQEDVIADLSEFIDDMRLLYNITNEYFIYREILDKDLDVNKLFAVIVYKNIHPDDFVLLGSNKGILFSSINEKEKYIEPLKHSKTESINGSKSTNRSVRQDTYYRHQRITQNLCITRISNRTGSLCFQSSK